MSSEYRPIGSSKPSWLEELVHPSEQHPDHAQAWSESFNCYNSERLDADTMKMWGRPEGGDNHAHITHFFKQTETRLTQNATGVPPGSVENTAVANSINRIYNQRDKRLSFANKALLPSFVPMTAGVLMAKYCKHTAAVQGVGITLTAGGFLLGVGMFAFWMWERMGCRTSMISSEDIERDRLQNCLNDDSESPTEATELRDGISLEQLKQSILATNAKRETNKNYLFAAAGVMALSLTGSVLCGTYSSLGAAKGIVLWGILSGFALGALLGNAFLNSDITKINPEEVNTHYQTPVGTAGA